MEFFRNLFRFLFQKKNPISKKSYTYGYVFVAACMITVFILGIYGYMASMYGNTQEKEQSLVVKETEEKELEDLTEEEEELASRSMTLDGELPISSTVDELLSVSLEEEATNELAIKDEPEEELSTSSVNQEDEIEDNPSTASTLTLEDNLESEKDTSYEVPSIEIRDEVSLSQEDIDVLERIVEAEVGNQDLYMRTLIANVVINRMYTSYYPDTIKEVVFQKSGSAYQFSPILDGRYYKVQVSDLTKEAVNMALEGIDNSDGAIAFVNPSITSDYTMRWFNNSLQFVMQYGEVELFTFK